MELFAKLGIDWRLFIAQLINFAILMTVLVFVLFKPIIKALDKRRQKIAESLENAEKISAELKRTTEEGDRLLSSSRAEAQRIIGEAQKQSDAVRNGAADKAKVEVAGIIASGKAQLSAERDAMLAEVRHAAAELVADATAKVVGEKLNPAKDKALIEKALKSA
jgi:F-type H+-transporting ATPase subunit b